MHGKFMLLSPGKASSHSMHGATQLFSFLSLSAVFSCFHTSGYGAYSFATDVYIGSLTCAQIWVCAVHTKGGQAQTSLHKSWNCTIPCPARGSNPGPTDLNSNALTTEPRLPSKRDEEPVFIPTQFCQDNMELCIRVFDIIGKANLCSVQMMRSRW